MISIAGLAKGVMMKIIITRENVIATRMDTIITMMVIVAVVTIMEKVKQKNMA
jgi:hypothetical protein